jgi:hypothetical protein
LPTLALAMLPTRKRQALSAAGIASTNEKRARRRVLKQRKLNRQAMPLAIQPLAEPGVDRRGLAHGVRPTHGHGQGL